MFGVARHTNGGAPGVTFTAPGRQKATTIVPTPVRSDTGPRSGPTRTAPITRQRQRTPDEDQTPLGRIETAFVLLSEQVRPRPIRLPASLVGGPPDEQLTPLDLRTRLMLRLDNNLDLHVDGQHISDRVWTYVATRARRERGDWLTIAVGLAMRALRAMIGPSPRPGTEELVHSDLVYRLVTALAGDDHDTDDDHDADTEPPPTVEADATPTGPPHQNTVDTPPTTFDITAPYLFRRLMDRVRYAATRSPRRSSAPQPFIEFDKWEADELLRAPDSHRLHRPDPRDPLVVLARLVRNKTISRLDAALIARTALGGWAYPDAFAAVRTTLPDEAGTATDDALRGRLTRARQAVGAALRQEEDITDAPKPTGEPRASGAQDMPHAPHTGAVRHSARPAAPR